VDESLPPKPHKPRLLERLSALLLREPEDREQLVELLHNAYERQLLDADALSIIEGALQVSEMTARDIMIPRAQMDTIKITDETILLYVHYLEPRVSSVTLAQSLYKMARVAACLDPERDWRWLKRVARRLDLRAKPRDKRHEVVEIKQLLALTTDRPTRSL